MKEEQEAAPSKVDSTEPRNKEKKGLVKSGGRQVRDP